ncbi:zinc dependent phospholipase C family protein [Hymenobacter jejuensis]|nr:zinc dependent phospholipase C family protein [Hymenobacter jejuensis]
MKKLSFTLALVLLLPVLSPGWGFFAHKTIAQLAVYSLPGSMQGFYYRHMGELVKKITAPDERRESDPAEAPKHFIDMDHYGSDPFGAMPKEWDKAVAKYSADTLRKYGTVPWVVTEVKEKLTEAFRQRDTVAIITLSADLGHYVSDAFVPLHTTENYDGQLSNQAGLHSLWESKLPERHIADYKLRSKPGSYLKDPQAAIWQVVQRSYGFLGATFDMEEEVSRKYTPETKYTYSHKYGKTRRAYSDAFADAYHEKVGGMVMNRLQLAPTMVASMWLTAWKDAGSPDLDLLMKKPSKEEKEKLASELKLWKDNQLVPQNQLLAMQKEKTVERPDEIKSAVDMAPAPTEPEPAVAVPAPAAQPAPVAAPAKAKVKAKSDDGIKQKTKVKAAKTDDGWN